MRALRAWRPGASHVGLCLAVLACSAARCSSAAAPPPPCFQCRPTGWGSGVEDAANVGHLPCCVVQPTAQSRPPPAPAVPPPPFPRAPAALVVTRDAPLYGQGAALSTQAITALVVSSSGALGWAVACGGWLAYRARRRRLGLTVWSPSESARRITATLTNRLSRASVSSSRHLVVVARTSYSQLSPSPGASDEEQPHSPIAGGRSASGSAAHASVWRDSECAGADDPAPVRRVSLLQLSRRASMREAMGEEEGGERGGDSQSGGVQADGAAPTRRQSLHALAGAAMRKSRHDADEQA